MRIDRKKLTTAADAALAVALTGAATACSSSTAATQRPPSIEHVARAHHLTGCQHETPDLYASAEMICRMGGSGQVELVTFATDTLRDEWLNAVSQFGPVLFEGHGYAATTA